MNELIGGFIIGWITRGYIGKWRALYYTARRVIK